MYIPSHFAQTDHAEILRLMTEYSFATLCSVDNEGVPFATHLPLLIADPTPGAVVLEGHLARANSQWRHADGKPVVAIFHGPHHFISPTWYEEPDTVPTWNYLAVHATGTFHASHDTESLQRIVMRTVEVYESALPIPWRPEEGSVEKLLGGIIAFRIDVKVLDGKWKLNQNHSPMRRQRVIAALEKHGGEDARAIAERMRRIKG